MKSVAERAATLREKRKAGRLCKDCGAKLNRERTRCGACQAKATGKRSEKREADNERKLWESNKTVAAAATEGVLALRRIGVLRDRTNRLEDGYDNLAKRFAERLDSALPPEKPERLAWEDFPPLPPVLHFPDGADLPDWPKKPLKSLKQKNWNYEDPLSDVYAFAMWFYLKNVPQMEFRSHEKKWVEEGLQFTIALTEWLQWHERALQRDNEAMRRATIDLYALVKERAPDLVVRNLCNDG